MKHVLLCLPAIALGTTHFSEEASQRGVAESGKSFAVAMADVDADGDLDIFVTNAGSSNRLYLNTDGKGEFTDVTSQAGVGDSGPSRGAAFADVNGDGLLDLFVTASGGKNILYTGHGHGKFKDSTAAAGVGDAGFGQGACFADVDNDGDLDLFVANFGQSNILYLNNGKGIFEDVTAKAGLSNPGVSSFGCDFGDVDEDGDLDLIVHNSKTDNNLYINDGKGSFTDTAAQAGVAGDKSDGRGVSFADLNGDGHLDLFFVGPLAANRLYLGDGTGHFVDDSSAAGVDHRGAAQGFNIADVDGDGDLDIFVSSILETGTLYENDGTGHFTDITSDAGVDYHLFGQGVAFGDLDGDGDLDMYVNTWGTPPAGWPTQANKLLINQAEIGAWLKVRPVDENGHATVLHTEVRVYNTNTHTQAAARARVDGGSAFASQNGYDAYFGLSDAVASGAKTFDIEIKCGGDWITKGTQAELGGVSPNQIVKTKCVKPNVFPFSLPYD